MNGYIRGFWCECWTEDLARAEQPAFHSSFDAYSASQADRWIAIAGRIQTRRALLRSEFCTVTINQGGTRISWTARPALFLPLAHRRSLELPSCAYDFKPHATD
ncbi:hypothetical protein [Streptomyces sp. NPDC048243]|uniref:hypothetical protein n=1 Tax=Streptomyces sp. NPDC048243 TaxID=3365522 RepID=UPI00371A13CF